MLLKTPQVVVPEPLVLRDPVPHGAESFGDEVVAAFAAVPLLGHQSGIEQDAEVLGDGGTGHHEVCRNRVDGAVGLGEEVEYAATRRMTDRPEDVLLAIPSSHHVA